MKNKDRCRLCLKSIGTFSLYSVVNDVNIFYMLKFCCSIYVERGDGYPENVCKTCANKLKKSFNFKLACLETDYKLRNILDCTTILEKIKNGLLYISSQTQTVTYEDQIKQDERPTAVDIKKEDIKNEPNENSDVCPSSKQDSRRRKSKKPIANGERILIRTGNDSDGDYDDTDAPSAEYGDDEIKPYNEERAPKSIKAVRKTPVDTRDRSQNDDSTSKLSIPGAKRRKRRLTKYVCEKCGYAANDRTSLNVHNRSHTGERPYICTICHKSFAVGENLKAHVRRHTGEKPFVCHACGKAFSAMSSLRGHMRTHSGERPYACETCGRNFTLRSNMLQHARIHTNDRPHKCKLCERRFISHSDLNAHARTHSGERPHACVACGRRFANSWSLAKHSLVHTGQRDHVCGHCGRGYISKSSLIVHIKTRHAADGPIGKRLKKPADAVASKRHVCSHCDKGFVKKSSLKSHMRKHKPESEWVEVHRIDPGVRVSIASNAGRDATRQIALRDRRLQIGDGRAVGVATVVPITVIPVAVVTS